MHLVPEGHRTPHPPQLAESVRVSTSQPLEGLPSQFAVVLLHGDGPQAPLEQKRDTPRGSVTKNSHRLPHPPQFVTLVRGSVSQPLAGSPSQFA